MDKFSKELIGASSKPIILGVLLRGETYGYELIRQVKEVSGGKIEWEDGMLYPVMHKLERKGLVESEWKIAENGRKRKYYSITSEGRKELAFEQEQWSSMEQIMSMLWKIDLRLG